MIDLDENKTPEAIIAEAMVSAGAPLMHSRVEEAVALKGVYLKKRALKITRKNGDIEYVEVPAEAMSTCPAVDYWHLAGTTYRLACELPAGHDNGGNDHLEAGELDAGGLRHLLGLRSEALARVAARAESAEAEVVTLRARLAAVEALADQWADRKRSDGMSGNAWIGLTLSGVAADLRAALATTGEGE